MNGVTRLPKIGDAIAQMREAVLLYRQKIGCVVSCFGWSVVVNFCFVGAIFLTAVAINVEHPPFQQHFIIAPFSMTANAIPLPGGVGGMELILTYFYDALASSTIETKFGVVVAFTFRIQLLCMAGLGAIAWFLGRKQIEDMVGNSDFSVERAS